MKSTLHISLPDRLVKQVREVAYRKRRQTSHLCRDFIEAGVQEMVKEDQDVAAAVDTEA